MSDGATQLTVNVRDVDTSCKDKAMAQELVCSNCKTPAKGKPPTRRPETPGSRNRNEKRRKATVTKNKPPAILGGKSNEQEKPKLIADKLTAERKETSNRRPSFPEKLMDLLRRSNNESTEENKKQATPLRWLPDGKGFEIVSIHRFTLEVLPHFFGQTEYSSFTRKLYWWGFKKARLDGDAFYHDLFMRDDPKLCSKIRARRSGYHEYVLPVTCSGESPLHRTNEKADFKKQLSSSLDASATSKREAPSCVSFAKRLRLSGDDMNFLHDSTSDDICLNGQRHNPLPPSFPLSVADNQNFAVPTAGVVSFRLYPSSSTTITRPPIICDAHHQHQGSNTQNCIRNKIECVSLEEGRVSFLSNTPACALSVALADKQEERMRKNRRDGLHHFAGDEDLVASMLLRLQEQALVLNQAHHHEERQKLLAAAALVEVHSRRAREFQRQQLDAKFHAAAAAVTELDTSGSGSSCPGSSSQVGGRLPLVQEEIFLKKSQELLAASDELWHRTNAISLEPAPQRIRWWERSHVTDSKQDQVHELLDRTLSRID